MSAIPLTDAPSFAPAAQRTFIIRVVLAAALAAAVVAAMLDARNPHAQTIVSLPSDSTAIIVLDLSASISSDTYSRIGATLSSLARSRGRFGLVVFPFFLALAWIGGRHARANAALAGLSALLLGVFVTQWALWDWVA